MKDWNVVVTTRAAPGRLRRSLTELGFVDRTHYHGVFVMNVPDPAALAGELDNFVARHPEAAQVIGRVAPLTHGFDFRTPEEFAVRAKQVVEKLAPQLAGKHFYVRIHRRGFKHRLHRTAEERRLDELLLRCLEAAGAPGRIDFEHPDLVVLIETVDTRAGVALLTREEMEQHPLLHVD